MASYRRNGFRMPTNTLTLLLIFFVIGLFLHFGGKTKPIMELWDNFTEIFSADSPPSRNPYKAPEPDTFATDDPEADNYASDDWTEQPNPPAAPTTTEERAADVPADELERIANQRDFYLPARQRNDQLVRRVGYSLNYAEKYELPAWVAYVLRGSQLRGVEERENEFMPDPVVKTGTAVTADYTRSGYDRGHMAPAADFKNSYQVMKETFYMSNICPQVPQFNRGIWLELEKMVRAWAYKYDRVFVVTGPVLTEGLPTIGRLNKVAVPRQFYKVVLYVNPPYVKGIAFLMNNEPSDKPLSSFVVSIDRVESLTGIDFFPGLPDPIEKQTEARSNPGEWYRLK